MRAWCKGAAPGGRSDCGRLEQRAAMSEFPLSPQVHWPNSHYQEVDREKT